MVIKFKSLDEIDDAVTEWHESDTDEPLHVFLGMTWAEYTLYVTNLKEFKKKLKTNNEVL